MENELRRKTAGSSQTTLIVIDDDEINRGILENLFSPVYAVERRVFAKFCKIRIGIVPSFWM